MRVLQPRKIFYLKVWIFEGFKVLFDASFMIKIRRSTCILLSLSKGEIAASSFRTLSGIMLIEVSRTYS